MERQPTRRMLVVVDGSPCTQRSVIVTAAALESAVSIIVVANPARSRLRGRLSTSWVKRLLVASDVPVLVVGMDPVRPGRFLPRVRLARSEATLGHA